MALVPRSTPQRLEATYKLESAAEYRQQVPLVLTSASITTPRSNRGPNQPSVPPMLAAVGAVAAPLHITIAASSASGAGRFFGSDASPVAPRELHSGWPL